jgi:hypothetical protein
MGGGLDTGVYSIAIGSDGLYVEGNFTYLADGTTQVCHIARWDSNLWHALYGSSFVLGGGVDSTVYAIAISLYDVYMGGEFEKAGGRQANYLARWSTTDTDWYSLGYSVNGPVFAVAIDGDEAYVGGVISSANGIPINRIAVWHKSTRTWSDLGGGVSGCHGMLCTPLVNSIVVDGGIVYVGGNFSNAGGVAASNIATWNKDLHAWEQVGGGVSGCTGIGCSSYVNIIVVVGGEVMVGGKFIYAGATTVNNISSWSGSSWYNFASGTNGPVYAIAYDNNRRYIGGNFTSPANYIAYFEGTWHSLPGGSPNAPVHAIDVYSSSVLLVGGEFTNLGGTSGHIAKYDSYYNLWYPLGEGLNNTVCSIIHDANNMYAGGDFTASGIQGINRLAKGLNEGAGWSGFGNGLDGTVNIVCADGGLLYVGGSFLNAGGKSSVYFGRWGIIHMYIPVVMK